MIFNIPRDLNLLAPTIVPDLIRVGGAGDILPKCLEISFLRSDQLLPSYQKRDNLTVGKLDLPCSPLKDEYQL